MKSRLLGAFSASIFAMTSIGTAHAVSVSGQGTWETTLQGRDLDGVLTTAEAYFDTVLGITWLADANYAGTEMTWATANAWAAALNPYGSNITGWRLPTVSPIDGSTADDATRAYNGTEDLGYNMSAPGTLYAGSTASEMAHMFYNTLGDKGQCDPTSVYPSCIQIGEYGLTNTGPFSNFSDVMFDNLFYYSATEYAPNTSRVWIFSFENGSQDHLHKFGAYAWAVHTGDVGVAVQSAVPVPAAAWLFGSGLMGLIGVSSKCRHP